MAFFRRLWVQHLKADPPHAFEDDDVYPVHTLDDTKTFRSILITWTICFNDALDAERLRSSLSRLLELGDWRKIGGRLRLKVFMSCVRRSVVDDVLTVWQRTVERWKSTFRAPSQLSDLHSRTATKTQALPSKTTPWLKTFPSSMGPLRSGLDLRSSKTSLLDLMRR